MSLAIQQPEVHSPGIDANALDLTLRRRRSANADLDLGHQVGKVPVQSALLLNGFVRETMGLFEDQGVSRQATQHDTTALCPHIHRDVVLSLAHPTILNTIFRASSRVFRGQRNRLNATSRP